MHIALVTSRDLPELDQDDAPLARALRDRGATVATPVWDDTTVDWSVFDHVVIRTTWDYTERREDFIAWAHDVAARTRLSNPPEVVRWNTHKGYLIELEERGAPVVPTAWLAQGDEVDLATLLRRQGWRDAVAKPAVGSGSRGLVRLRLEDLPMGQVAFDALLATGDVMVQPFLRSIESTGELSMVVIDGRFSHAVRKRPRPGEIRIQVEYGGRYEIVEPSDDERRLAEWIVESTGHDLLYARVDVVADEGGSLQLVELEATEPSLYLTVVPEAAGHVADAIIARTSADT